MLESIIQRLELAEERFKFLESEISSTKIINDQKTYSSYAKEYFRKQTSHAREYFR